VASFATRNKSVGIYTGNRSSSGDVRLRNITLAYEYAHRKSNTFENIILMDEMYRWRSRRFFKVRAFYSYVLLS
jgi:hypothetical protein